MWQRIESLWVETAAPDAPGPLRRDWVFVAIVVALAAAEFLTKEGMVWPVLSLVVITAQALTLPWRRVHPLRVVFTVFGATTLVQLSAYGSGADWSGFVAGVFVLVYPYALLRWGTGRQAFVGFAFMAMSMAITLAANATPWNEVIGGSLFLLFPASLGAAVRYQDSGQRRARDEVRTRERERLARELHDTVAHHVSAIAIQAQAGRAMAATNAQAPVETLKVIEEAASRTLTEMRDIVRALRDDEQAQRSPAASLADIERLAADETCPLRVDVTLSGELDDMTATMASTLFRMAQESVTNAVRHADRAQTVSVRIEGDNGRVLVAVSDDGAKVAGDHAPGLGLRGMAERVALLGGTLRAGPRESGGWTVEASLPKNGVRS